MLMEVLPRSSCWRGGVGGSGDTGGGRFLDPIVGSEVQCTSLRLLELCAFVCTRVWGHVYVHMPFGYLCSDPMIETSWITTTESVNWTISPSVPVLTPPNSTSSSQT